MVQHKLEDKGEKLVMLFRKSCQNPNCKCNCGMNAKNNQTRVSYSLADKIRECISGKEGELSSVFTYLFQSFISNEEKIKNAILEVSQNEMEHIEKLSNLLVVMGEEPIFVGADKNYYTTKWVNYETCPKVFLKQNIEAERGAIKRYMDLIEETTNENVIQTILSIIDDEKEHIEIFNRLMETVGVNKIN